MLRRGTFCLGGVSSAGGGGGGNAGKLSIGIGCLATIDGDNRRPRCVARRNGGGWGALWRGNKAGRFGTVSEVKSSCVSTDLGLERLPGSEEVDGRRSVDGVVRVSLWERTSPEGRGVSLSNVLCTASSSGLGSRTTFCGEIDIGDRGGCTTASRDRLDRKNMGAGASTFPKSSARNSFSKPA